MARAALSLPCPTLAPCLAAPKITPFNPPTAREPTREAEEKQTFTEAPRKGIMGGRSSSQPGMKDRQPEQRER